MRRTAYILLILSLMVILPSAASAVTVTPAPSTADVGQTVVFNVVTQFAGTPGCSMNITYGDGSSQPFVITSAAGCTNIGSVAVVYQCPFTFTHAYNAPGTYTASVGSGRGGCKTPLLAPDPATATVTVRSPLTLTPVPSTVTVARGLPAGRNITYQFRGSGNATLQSPGGRFIAAGRVIGTRSVPMTASVVNGSADVPEFLNIPVDVVNKAAKLKVRQFEYRRSFSSGMTSLEAVVLITITNEAIADFNINRMELYFENRRPEITVERNTQKLKAYVDLRYTGSGFLEAYWEVDGRVISPVNQHLVYGRHITLETPDIPGLPTFNEGTHVVRFIITRPATDIQFPSIIYYVTSKTVRIAPPIRLTRPTEGFGADQRPVLFSWERPAAIETYLISFFDKPDGSPVFSALTKEPGYALSDSVVMMNFMKDHQYFWKVTGFNVDGMVSGESEKRAFVLK